MFFYAKIIEMRGGKWTIRILYIKRMLTLDL